VKWLATCNGGPNDTTMGQEYSSRGKAIGGLEAMMRSLGATIGQIEKIEDQRTLDQFPVKTEAEAGRSERKGGLQGG